MGALALILAAKVRVADLEREFMQRRKPLLEKFEAGTRIERHACAQTHQTPNSLKNMSSFSSSW